MATPAIQEIQRDGQRLIFLMGQAVEAENWAGVHHLAVQFAEISERGFYHAANSEENKAKLRSLCNISSEREAR
jgi:hypothetical protein